MKEKFIIKRKKSIDLLDLPFYFITRKITTVLKKPGFSVDSSRRLERRNVQVFLDMRGNLMIFLNKRRNVLVFFNKRRNVRSIRRVL